MKSIVIDTCVIVHIVRQDAIGIACLQLLNDMVGSVNIIVSVVTKAELESFSQQNSWGEEKLTKLQDFMNAATIIDIKQTDKVLIGSYVAIDGYSKGKLADKKGNLKTGSSIKMGKNDLWIAATAHTLNVPLMTTDNDFNHLHGVFLNVITVI